MKRPTFRMRLAGWHRSRKTRKVTEWQRALEEDCYEWFEEARIALEQFGGLAISSRLGTDVYLDPTLAIGERDRFLALAEVLNSRLIPLGEAEKGAFFLAIDEKGRVFLLNCVWLYLGRDMWQALAVLLSGADGAPISSAGNFDPSLIPELD